MSEERSKPVLIETEEIGPSPADVPEVDADAQQPTGHAMQMAAEVAATRGSFLARWFWRLLGTLLVFLLSIWIWNATAALIAKSTVLGSLFLGLVGVFVVFCLAIAVREWAALARMKRIDGLHQAAHAARASGDLKAAQNAVSQVRLLYTNRPEVSWSDQRRRDLTQDVLDADTLLDIAEREMFGRLDMRAAREVEVAARQVATVTALVPLAFADIAVALTANLRMIRRIAEIYGGRGGTLGAWRLTRTVFAHLVATGAVAVGDDLLGSIGGGHLLSRLSRRFGEGLVNGALTARVGVAAMEVCRPLPFEALRRPSVGALVKRALTGLFTSGTEEKDSP